MNLEEAIKNSWSAETSLSDDWTPENPALGQCAVTACVYQDYRGGDVVNAPVLVNDKEESHYFNLIDGKEKDLTRIQFPKGTHVPPGKEKKKNFNSTREYILSFENTNLRYQRLKRAVEEKLA